MAMFMFWSRSKHWFRSITNYVIANKNGIFLSHIDDGINDYSDITLQSFLALFGHPHASLPVIFYYFLDSDMNYKKESVYKSLNLLSKMTFYCQKRLILC